jgi:hypothetical protein
MERGEKETLDAVTFVEANGNRVKQERTSMFSTMCLDEVADMLSREFGSTVSLTLVEFKNGETARKVSPLGSRSRAVPILSKNQEVKKLGDLTIELARLLGSCTHCKLDKSKCNRVKDDKCGLETKRADAVKATIQTVKRELKFQPAPVAKLLGGDIVRLAFKKQTEKEQADEKQAIEEGQIVEELTAERQPDDDGLFISNPGDVLGACTSASNTNFQLNFEGKHSSDEDEQ